MCYFYPVWALRSAISSGFSWMLSPAWLRAIMQHCLCGNNHCCTPTRTGGAALSHASPQALSTLILLVFLKQFIFSLSTSTPNWLNAFTFQLFTISSNELDEMMYGFRFCGCMVIRASPRSEPAIQWVKQPDSRDRGKESMNTPTFHMIYFPHILHFTSASENFWGEKSPCLLWKQLYFPAWIKGNMETGFQRDAAKVSQFDCGEQIFRQMSGFYRSECLSYWTDCLNMSCTNLDLYFSSFAFHNFKLKIFSF